MNAVDKNLTTREKVRAAAWELIEEGISPSRTKVRERIGPGGSDTTVADELHLFWAALGKHIKNSKVQPDIPDEFVQAFKELIKQARRIEANRWQEERRKLTEKADLAEKERLTAMKAAELEKNARNSFEAALKKTQAKLTVESDRVTKLKQAQRQANERIESLQQQLQDARQRETELQRQKTEEIELSYTRARETEERLTRLYDEQRGANEKAAAALDRSRDLLQQAEREKAQLAEQLKEANKRIAVMKDKLHSLAELENSANTLQQENTVLKSQLETSLKRETEAREKLEKKISALARAELELASARNALQKKHQKHTKHQRGS